MVEATGKSPLRYSLDGNAYQTSPYFELAKPRSYSLTVEDSLGCQASQRVELLNDCQGGVYLPTAISPNGDGHNDELQLCFSYSSLTMEEFAVFDRWGSLLYRTQQPRALQSGQSVWSGQLAGSQLPVDVYAHQLRVTTPTGQQLFLQSPLTILSD